MLTNSGLPLRRKARTNYALFVGNGPRLVLEEEEAGEWRIEGVDASGLIDDVDGNKAVGGRLGFLPIPNLEIGISAAFADAGFAAGGTNGHDDHGIIEEDDHGDDDGDEAQHGDDGHESADHAEGIAGINIQPRDYTVFGADFFYRPQFLRNLVLRGEYVRTELGAGAISEDDPGEKSWEAWYLQGSYFFGERKLEPVFRYGEYTDGNNITRTQFAPGLNYRFANNVILKFSYEFNEVENIDHADDEDRFRVQLAFGF